MLFTSIPAHAASNLFLQLCFQVTSAVPLLHWTWQAEASGGEGVKKSTATFFQYYLIDTTILNGKKLAFMLHWSPLPLLDTWDISWSQTALSIRPDKCFFSPALFSTKVECLLIWFTFLPKPTLTALLFIFLWLSFHIDLTSKEPHWMKTLYPH